MNKFLGFLVGLRKFTIMLLYLLVMVWFRLEDLVDGSQFAENVTKAVIAFFGMNISEHMINLGKNWLQGKLKELKNGKTTEEVN